MVPMRMSMSDMPMAMSDVRVPMRRMVAVRAERPRQHAKRASGDECNQVRRCQRIHGCHLPSPEIIRKTPSDSA
jgi:hypothetical protein